MEAESRVREANERFYRALDSLDLRAMESLWAHDRFVRCVHPGWGTLVGWDAVRGSWEGIFLNTGAHRVEAAEVVVHVVGELGWVSCVERITVRARTDLVVATNLFQAFPDGWRMILHHASLLPGLDLDEMGTADVVH